MRTLNPVLLLTLLLCSVSIAGPRSAAISSRPSHTGTAAVGEAVGPGGDLAAARRLFQANLDAIRRKDRAAYLACYLDSRTLAKVGPDGPTLGVERFVKETGENWPDLFDAQDLQLVPVREGLVLRHLPLSGPLRERRALRDL